MPDAGTSGTSPRFAVALTLAAGHNTTTKTLSSEKAKRSYLGLNTHMMILRPSLDFYALLLANAALGHFVPYTRTEQDVIESAFPPTLATHLRAARAGAVAANEGGKDTKMNTTTMIRDLFMSDYDRPGAQLTGCIVDAGAAHSDSGSRTTSS